jgi:hypothetical protein
VVVVSPHVALLILTERFYEGQILAHAVKSLGEGVGGIAPPHGGRTLAKWVIDPEACHGDDVHVDVGPEELEGDGSKVTVTFIAEGTDKVSSVAADLEFA